MYECFDGIWCSMPTWHLGSSEERVRSLLRVLRMLMNTVCVVGTKPWFGKCALTCWAVFQGHYHLYNCFLDGSDVIMNISVSLQFSDALSIQKERFIFKFKDWVIFNITAVLFQLCGNEYFLLFLLKWTLISGERVFEFF